MNARRARTTIVLAGFALVAGACGGSQWEAGVDGAQPGVVMLAQPTVGESYHQEFLKGEAEDVGTVVALDDNITVPYGSWTRSW
jgi:hypothetical protein